MTRSKIQVLIVEDSPVDRELLVEIFQAEPDFVVAGQAADAFEAREKIRTLNPDVITLDVSMPGMDGIKFLRNLMRLRPMPVVMCSVTTEAGAAVTLDALEIGAVDFVAKPGASGRSFGEYRSEIIAKVRMAAYAQVTAYRGGPAALATPPAAPAAPSPASTPSASQDVVAPAPAAAAMAAAAPAPGPAPTNLLVAPESAAVRRELAAVPAPSEAVTGGRSLRRERATRIDLIAIGASTGGIAAIQTVLETLPVDGLPAVVITQHIPAGFSESFATRLDSQLELQVHQASDGLAIEAGHVYIAPGGHQFSIDAQGEGYVCRVSKEERVNLHRPSAQVLFQSVAKHAGARAVGVMLTGMGADGAEALLGMRQAGAYNLVQDEASSVVWGMPGAAVKLGAANEVLPLDAIGPAIGELVGATRGALKRRDARRLSARGAQPIQ
jgi:two-component system chemotaxis response regulator CheB